MKRKLNKKGITVLIIYILCIVQIVYDFIQLLKGMTFTPFGIATFIIAMGFGLIAESYLIEIVKEK